jgi:hypothetical protein
VSEGVLGTGDEDQIGRSLSESAYDRLSSADGGLAIAAKDRRCY